MNKFRKFVENNLHQTLSIVMAFMAAGILFQAGMWDFQANVLSGKRSAPFDGTSLPVKRVPNWVELSSSEWKLPYDQIPLNKFIDLPEYVPSELAIPFSSLDLKKSSDKSIRNAQVTFSTPYMGNYKLDGQEYAGSHLAVDIKIPVGTPIYAVANGLVVKATNQPSGFGNHVVLRHDDVPTLEDSNKKTTYFSGYAHMQSLSVSEGDLISKGQLIGFSGNSGTATTPHLHFQIDNDQAPWHLYWPYTSKEAADAGLSFWEAVNAGLGKDKAISTTINPLIYVQKYKNYGSQSNTPIPPVKPVEPTEVETPVINTTPDITNDELPPANNNVTEPVSVISQPVVDVKPMAPELADLQLKYNPTFQVGLPHLFKVIALDKNGEVITDYKPKGEVYMKVENGSAVLGRSYLNANDFQNGVAEFSITPTAGYGIRLSVTIGNISKFSDVIKESSFSDMTENDDSYVAVNFLKNNEIVKGYPDGTFKPGNAVSRVEALKFIYEGLNKEIGGIVVLEFTDTDSKAWYARYVATAQREGVVKGYAGNLFKPANSVTRAEFIKMLIESAGFNVNGYVPPTKPFSDVEVNAWYSGYVALAKDKNLLDTSTNLFRPNEPMTRGEVAQVLYKTILMKVSGGKKYEKSLVVNLDDLSDFYKKI